MEIIRSLLQTIATGIYRVFTGSGRGDEVLKGLLYQHYGFKSVPPVGCDLLTMLYGNNCISVAENDGDALIVATDTPFKAGDVYMYTGNNNFIRLNDDATATVSLTVKSDKDIEIICGALKNINLGSGVTQALANKAFVTAVGAALTTLAVPGFDPTTIATGIYNTTTVKAT
jgi:phage gp45-like